MTSRPFIACKPKTRARNTRLAKQHAQAAHRVHFVARFLRSSREAVLSLFLLLLLRPFAVALCACLSVVCMMEVASPLTLGPSSAGNKRSLACSPQQSMLADEMEERVTKRRRFHGAADMDSLSEDFSSHSLFYKNLPPSNKSIFATNGGKDHRCDCFFLRSCVIHGRLAGSRCRLFHFCQECNSLLDLSISFLFQLALHSSVCERWKQHRAPVLSKRN